jgi:type I restriction enzyme S subunit
MNWSEVPLGELAEFRNGLNYTKENEGTGLRVINVKDFGDRCVPEYESLGELNPQGILREEALLEDGDVIFCRSNGNKDLIGRSLLISHPPCNVSFSAFCIRARFHDKTQARFYSYFFRTPHFRKRLTLLGRGVNISNLNQQVLASIKVPRPAILTMAKIVSFIHAYDDLIENNRRRIQLLEQAARLLYNEWFVHLRFPGHEHVKITNGVPEGWTSCCVPDAIDINPTYPVPNPDCIRYIPMSALSTDGMLIDLRDTEIRDKSTSVRFQNGDVLFARITPCLENGKTGFVNCLAPKETACGSTEFIVLRGRLVSEYFTYCLSRTHEFRGAAIQSMIGSSGRQRVQVSCFADYRLAIPTAPVQMAFDTHVRKLFWQIQTLVNTNQRLTKARDLLLPRLMNGEIPV